MNTSASDSPPSGSSGLQVELGAKSRRHSATFWLALLAIALGVPLLAVVGTVILRGETPTTELAVAPAASLAPTIDLSSSPLFLHGTGNATNPSTLFLDAITPTGTTAKSKDSAGVKFSGGNPWADIGTWSATLAGANAATPTAVDTWVGLKNSDDVGTAFDVRAEVYQNQTLVASGHSLCIKGITRNANQATSVNVQLNASSVLTGTGTLNLKLITRIGTNADGTRCSGPGATHSNAVGLRAYFDATNRASRLTLVQATPETVLQAISVSLSNGDIEAAIRGFSVQNADRYRRALTRMSITDLQDLAHFFGNAKLIEETDDIRVYSAPFRERDGTFSDVTFTMGMDDIGVWRVISW